MSDQDNTTTDEIYLFDELWLLIANLPEASKEFFFVNKTFHKNLSIKLNDPRLINVYWKHGRGIRHVKADTNDVVDFIKKNDRLILHRLSTKCLRQSWNADRIPSIAIANNDVILLKKCFEFVPLTTIIDEIIKQKAVKIAACAAEWCTQLKQLHSLTMLQERTIQPEDLAIAIHFKMGSVIKLSPDLCNKLDQRLITEWRKATNAKILPSKQANVDAATAYYLSLKL